MPPFAGTGTILRELRIKAGKSIADVARELGISYTVPRKWEAGVDPISEARVPAVCRAYGCDVAAIRHLVNWRNSSPKTALPPLEGITAAVGDSKQEARELLRERRTQRGLNTVAMAALIGVSGPTISNWETGHSRISRRSTPAVCHRYGVTEAEIAVLITDKGGVLPSQRAKKKSQAVVAVPEKRPPASLAARQSGAPPPDGVLPAEVRLGIQHGGRVVLSATFQPGTPEGDRMARMAAEMLVNVN